MTPGGLRSCTEPMQAYRITDSDDRFWSFSTFRLFCCCAITAIRWMPAHLTPSPSYVQFPGILCRLVGGPLARERCGGTSLDLGHSFKLIDVQVVR